ncbi:DUF4426 domain-containing protein [Thiohalorhabdus sp.]|uniref:DUF4426 domain-containing protein n=1 Tax=Thiohalorhabdus sp. TaxID=3094134 RepID=UPI002FC3216F
MRHLTLALAALAALVTLPMSATAQKLFGDYVVHHGTMLTANLDPNVARQYDIQRSQNRGLVTVAVRKNTEEGRSKAVRADVRAVAVNLSAQRRELDMHEVDEAEAIYYLADFRIDPPETVRIEFHIQPEGSDETQVFEISREFHAE